MSNRLIVLGAILCSLYLVLATPVTQPAGDVLAGNESVALNSSLVPVVNSARCNGSRSIIRDTETVYQGLMNFQHTSLVNIQGYVMTLTRCTNRTDAVNHKPFNFTYMVTSYGYSFNTLVLYGANCSLEISMAANAVYELENSSETSQAQTDTARATDNYDIVEKYSSKDKSKYKTVMLNKFRYIYYRDPGENIHCIASNPDLVGFKDDEFYSCSARRVVTCNHSGNSDEIVSLVFDQLHIEIKGNHDTIFSNLFSKKQRNCVATQPPQTILQ